MKLDEVEESSNVEDVRGSGGTGGIGGRHIGIGSIVIALAASYFLGVNPLTVLGIMSGGSSNQTQQAPAHAPPQDDPLAKFVSQNLKLTEDVWTQVFAEGGAKYRDPKLVIFRGGTQTGCGTGQTAMGPFYCPADEKVYIDLDFYQTLKNKLGAPGEFAEAYVIAHEVGHHVQKLLGISDKMDAARHRMSEDQYNALSVRLELQADCFAGVWAQRAQNAKHVLENGDIESAMNAAGKIGDDTLQKRSQGYAVPETFTHGTSAQRVKWFNMGLQSGDIKQCDTFNARTL